MDVFLDPEKVKEAQLNKSVGGENYRLYFFVMYNLSGIQKGIQAGHAALEYVRFFGDTPEYQKFIAVNKTFILLSGGGSIDMEAREIELEDFGIPFASFLEPDLNYSLSAIAFLVPESIYDFQQSEIVENLLDGKLVHPPVNEEDVEKLYSKYKVFKYLKQFKLAPN